MFIKEDHTYQEMKRSAAIQWLEEQAKSEDLVDKNGAKVTLEYISYLKKQIKVLEDKSALKDEFLKKLKKKLLNASKESEV